jgi:hypothetical protein
VGGVQADDPLTFTATKAVGKFTDLSPSYQFQVRSGSTVVYDSGTVGGTGSGSNVAFAPSATLDPQTTFTWRVRAVIGSAVGPWSSDASFQTPVGAYIRDSEIRDPLTIGRTVGQLMGNATMTPKGVSLPDLDSFVQYVLPQTLSAGSFSMMITNLSTKVHGAKSSVFSMGQGFGDITTNPYRFTADFRARDYPTPGAVTARIITGNPSVDFDSNRIVIGGWDPAKWYFWQASWQTGSYNLIVRQDSETGPILYNQTTATNSHPYAPSPHVLYLGKPLPRGGDIDGTASPIVVKNVWVSANPRPVFPG